MPDLDVIAPVLFILPVAYRYYSAFLATKVYMLNDSRRTPAHVKNDGHNFHPTPRWVLFGHHFAAITGAGPLIGPVLAAQFGYCLLYTSDAADERSSVDLGGRRIIKKKKRLSHTQTVTLAQHRITHKPEHTRT